MIRSRTPVDEHALAAVLVPTSRAVAWRRVRMVVPSPFGSSQLVRETRVCPLSAFGGPSACPQRRKVESRSPASRRVR